MKKEKNCLTFLHVAVACSPTVHCLRSGGRVKERRAPSDRNAISTVQLAIFSRQAMTVQKIKPRGTGATEEQQPSTSDIFTPSEPHENDKEQSEMRNCYRGQQDSENLLGCVLAGE